MYVPQNIYFLQQYTQSVISPIALQKEALKVDHGNINDTYTPKLERKKYKVSIAGREN